MTNRDLTESALIGYLAGGAIAACILIPLAIFAVLGGPTP